MFPVCTCWALKMNRDGRLILTVESDQVQTGCPSCGVIAASHGRRPRMLHGLGTGPPFGGGMATAWNAIKIGERATTTPYLPELCLTRDSLTRGDSLVYRQRIASLAGCLLACHH